MGTGASGNMDSLATRLGNRWKNRRKYVQDTLLVVGTSVYLMLAGITKEVMPGKIMGSLKESRKNFLETGKRLVSLRDELIVKAEKYDGKPGLSFEDAAYVARQLGYQGIFTQEQYRYFNIFVNNVDCSFNDRCLNSNGGLGIYLNLGGYYLKVDEEKAKKFLEDKLENYK